MINPYKKIREQEKQLAGSGKEIDKLNLEINELKDTPHTSIHPVYKHLIQEVIEIDGRMLYEFKDILDMPHNRYNNFDRFSLEFKMRLDLETSIDLDKKIKENIEKGTQKAILDIYQIADHRIRMAEMTLGLEHSYRLVSCAWFWKDENLDEYDFEIGDEKIRLFKKEGLESFFLHKSMKKFLPQINISVDVLKACSRYEKQYQSLLTDLLKKETETKDKMIT